MSFSRTDNIDTNWQIFTKLGGKIFPLRYKQGVPKILNKKNPALLVVMQGFN